MTREQAETVRRDILASNPGALIDIVESNGEWAVVPRSAPPTLGAGAAAGSGPEATPQRPVATTAAPVASTPSPASAASLRPAGAGELALPADSLEEAAAELSFPGRLTAGTASRKQAKRVQEWCCLHNCPTPIDGDFDDGAKRAVMRFQAGRGLPETGEVDEDSWAELTAPLRRAIGPLPAPPRESLYDAVVQIARHHLAQRPTEPPGGKQNTGPWVRLYMDGIEGEQWLWCAGFVCFVVGQAAHALHRPMPIKRRVACDDLVADARRDGRFIADATLDSASRRLAVLRPGMIFVRRHSASDWNHTGLVSAVAADSFDSIEGNTNPQGSNNGGEMRELSHGYRSYDFIALEPLR